MNKKVLFVAVHPDDETLGCGGTILKHKAQGDEISWLIITSWNEGNALHKNQAEMDKRKREIEQVSKMYAFDHVINLGLPVIELYSVDILALIQNIEKAIDTIKPDTIYLMFKNDVHSDHRIAFDACFSCTKSFRKPWIKSIYMCETISETDFAPALSSDSFIPNVYVDITDFFAKKLEILKVYDTELMRPEYSRSLSSVEALARYRGSRAGVMYAESFMLLYDKR